MPLVFNINIGSSKDEASTGSLAESKALVNTSDTTAPTKSSTRTTTKSLSTTSLMVGAMVGKRTLSYMASNVGKWSGNSYMQEQVNNVGTMVGLGIGLYTNPVMTIVGSALALTTTAINTAYEQKWDSIRSNQQKAIAGELKGVKH